MLNTALWYLFMDQEFVYVGDEGIVEPSGRTRRTGIDVSVRYQPLKWLYVDMDVNVAKARAVDASKGEDYLPLAPELTSVGGITIQSSSRISGNLRYRYMGNRPANEDNSTIAKGYFVTDGVLNYNLGKIELSAAAQNLFNTKWKETQFDTESRLANETDPVTEIHFTPGTPFSLRFGIAYKFN
jgi:outer membrane receptor for ferrienterochelin and colicin